ncbi:hypothetical protein [Castellaniella sp.]|uniref:hypothetical protein n=1 Tax=Castellaniella sp. TaxID=1955812 RepID=UPI002AFF0B1F|nr:hypothetical protein [Castellaniella sp.]
MPYAANGQISTLPIDGGIEISDEQYAAALAGLHAGKIVSIETGFALIDPPPLAEPRTAEPDPEEPQPRTILSSREYLMRFTNAEYSAARASSSIDMLRAYDSLIAAQFVDLTDPAVGMGLDLMVSLGIIDADRKAELLMPEPVA